MRKLPNWLMKLPKYLLAALAGYLGTVAIVLRDDIEANYKTQGKHRVDHAEAASWGIMGAGFMVLLVLLRQFWLPVFRLAKRHPKLLAGIVVVFDFVIIKIIGDAVAATETALKGKRCTVRTTKQDGLVRPMGWQFSGDLPAAADDVLGIGPSWIIRRHPLSDGAYFDSLGARAERRMLAEYHETGRLPGEPRS